MAPKTTIGIFLLAGIFGILFSSARSSAQVKKWIDENGVTHFEAQSSGKPAPRETEGATKDTAGKSKAKIDRSHAGQTLGDNDSSYRSSAKWIGAAQNKFGAQFFLERATVGNANLGVMFLDQRLAMIKITYTEIALGGWARAVQDTTDKYGKPQTDGYSKVEWSDGQTFLKLEKNFRGGVDATIGDVELIRTYQSRSGETAPKF